ncbi:MAG: TIGR04013 family B12-binding domain/radical SAM domain-containing protein [Candidatus Wallbacteria bacterium HGW-Wallbacteria-1]|jgi:B12-binding domain/radical SAM domain protein|uniref:TIGR04013 family B12-binding domain/radical SAM domain-containing protein n=1 Tax=Candidatus Wallbacteria bacterium HGW-Wallbacteria-1 TaxID=2013854 RepID=A0A2N1PVG8_9BACT|nr:MAG: TIGR04013 family B12-binding domain/radical SAM domain-containing protein [Candidatus Wallbacteria bacterium HGW-Wallbacteria-1]
MKLIFLKTQFNRTSIRALLSSLEIRLWRDDGNLEIEVMNLSDLNRICGENIQDNSVTGSGCDTILCLSFSSASRIDFSELIHKVRESNWQPLVIAGGAHVSSFLSDAFVMGVDVAFPGQAEESLAEFIEKSLGFSESGRKKWFAELRASAQDLREIVKTRPELARGMMLDWGFLKSENLILPGRLQSLDVYPCLPEKNPLIGPLEITRGCSFGCAYCEIPRKFNESVIHRSPDILIRCAERFGMWSMRFISPDSFSYPWMSELFEGLAKVESVRDIYWGSFPSEVRPDSVTLSKMQMVSRMCSNRNVVIGAQTGSDAMLNRIGRGHSVEDVENAARICRMADLNPLIDIIVGLPGESEEDDQATAAMCERLVKRTASRFTMHTFMPLPGSRMRFEESGTIGKHTLAFINKYRGKGVVQGNWEKQESLATQLRDLYVRYGIIE